MVSASLALPPARGLLPLPLSVLAVPRREKPRSSRPRVPEDFFSAEAQALLADLLARRAAAWQADDTAPLYFYGQHSAPLWGEEAAQRCSGRRLRAAKRWALCESLSLELERGLRLLTLGWTPAGTTAEGHTMQEWRAALAGVCWRVGQLYRELTRREGEAGALHILRLAMGALWG